MLSAPSNVLDFPTVQHTATLAVNLLIQTTLVLSLGLLTSRIIRRRGAALQSSVLRMTLLATLLCPIASWSLSLVGISGFRLELDLFDPKPEQTETLNVTNSPSLKTDSLTPEPVLGPQLAEFDLEPTERTPVTSPGLNRVPEFAIEQRSVETAALVVSPAELPQLPTVETPQPTSSPRGSLRFLFCFGICAIWFCGSGCLLCRLIVANLLMERLRRRSRLAPQDVVCDCRDIAQLMCVTAPPVLINDMLSSPCLLGWLRPAVMIPADLRPISPDVLAHELAHLSRHDCLWSLLGHLTTALMPWQPLVWLLNRRMEQAADNVCDDYVVAHRFDRVSYARELVSIAERFPASWSATTAAVGIAEFQSCLGSRVQRILDCSRTLSIQTGWKNLLFVIIAALTGTIAAGLLGAARNGFVPEIADAANAPAENQEKAKPTESKLPDEVFVTGVVLMPDGSPAVGATVRSLGFVWPYMEKIFLRLGKSPEVVETKTDSKGQFTIAVKTRPFGNVTETSEIWGQFWKQTPIAASLPGYGPSWVNFSDIEKAQPVTLRLIEDLPVRGQFVDLEGNPVAGLPVEIAHNVQSVFSVSDPNEQHGPSIIDPRVLGIPTKYVTDKEGWIEIRGMGKGRTTQLKFFSETVAFHAVFIHCRDVPTFHRTRGGSQSGSQPVYGFRFKHVVAPARPIEGIVVDAATGVGLPGVSVESMQHGDFPTFINEQHYLTTLTDASGRFTLHGMAKAAGNELLVFPNEEQPYLVRKVEVPDPQGSEPVELKIELHRGVWIKGRVTDNVTHEPVGGVQVYYMPFLTNKFAQQLPEFDRDDNMDGDYGRFHTDRDGTYRLVGLPGRALVGAHSTLKRYRDGVGYSEVKSPQDENKLLVWSVGQQWPRPDWPNVIREIDPGEGEQEIRLDLELEPGLSLPLKLVDEQGNLVTGAEVEEHRGNDEITETGRGTVSHLSPGVPRYLLAHHKTRNIARVMLLKPMEEMEKEVTMELVPCATLTGRLLDSGNPLSKLPIRCSISMSPIGRGSLSCRLVPGAMTDAEGRFRLTLPAGCEYNLRVDSFGLSMYGAIVAEDVAVQAGETTDLGDMNFEKDPDHDFFRFVKIASAKTRKKADQLLQLPEEIQVTGTVLRPDGTPAAGATIRSKERNSLSIILRTGGPQEVVETKADAEGRFTIALRTDRHGNVENIVRGWREYWKWGQISASLPEYGAAWVKYGDLEIGKPITLRLVEDLPVRGRLVDLEGNPVAGTCVVVSERMESSYDIIDPTEPATPAIIEPTMMGIPETLITDNDGRFEIRGLGKERTTHLKFFGENAAYREVFVVTREMEPVYRTSKFPFIKGTQPVFGARFECVVAPARPIEGRVVDALAGTPLAGVSVESYQIGSFPTAVNRRPLKTITDANGQFSLVGMSKSEGNVLLILPNNEQPYFIRKMDVPNADGIEPVSMKIELHRGIWIKGQVTDKVTREPVAGVQMHYLPFRDNEFAQQLPEFHSDGNADHDQGRYPTDLNGNYRVVGLPGHAIVCGACYLKSYRDGFGYAQVNGPKDKQGRLLTWRTPFFASSQWPTSMREINPSNGEEEVRLDLELDPGLSAVLNIVDQQGKAVVEAEIAGLDPTNGVKITNGAPETVANLNPDETRVLRVYHKERQLGFVTEMKPPQEPGRVVKMELLPCATVTGRLLNAGDPMPAVTIEPRINSGSHFGQHLNSVTTSADGRFQITLLPGCEYYLHAEGKGITDYYAVVANNLAIKPGETKDLGDLVLAKDRKFEPVNTASPEAP